MVKAKAKGIARFILEQVAPEVCKSQAKLYETSRPVIVALIRANWKANDKTFGWNISKELLASVRAALIIADKRINRDKEGAYKQSETLKDYLNETGCRHTKTKRTLRCLIVLQRDICRMRGFQGDMSIYGLSSQDTLGLKADDKTCRLREWRVASCLVGRSNPVTYDPEVKFDYVQLMPSQPLTRLSAMTPAKLKLLADSKSNWRPIKEAIYSTVSPFAGMKKLGRRQTRLNMANSAKMSHFKKAGNVPDMIATLARIELRIIEMLDSFKHPDVDHKLNKKLREDLIRLNQVKIYIGFQITHPGRGCEILDMSFDDLYEAVVGAGKGGFSLVFRALLDRKALPRGEVYMIRRLYNKTKVTTGVLTTQQDMLPHYASAISLPDMIVRSMRLILRLDMDMYLDPERNPYMHIFVGTGKKFGSGPLTTKAMDAQLQGPNAMPPCAVHGHWGTCYSGRVMAAVTCLKLGFLEDKELAQMIAEWMAHEPSSGQTGEYGKSDRRFLSCKHEQEEGEGECTCSAGKRVHTDAQKAASRLKRKQKHDARSDNEKVVLVEKAKASKIVREAKKARKD